MIGIIADNLANIIISAILLVCAVLAILKIRKDKKSGDRCCSCHGCPSSSTCHKNSGKD
ncbi:MAG TPA: FeoB-associated Cys-rich membrane protein [Acetivibrio sp.]|mgnify:FL=1|nr:FeoB-associated Cys-rich membrane protein [Acetivibrio sp.]